MNFRVRFVIEMLSKKTAVRFLFGKQNQFTKLVCRKLLFNVLIKPVFEYCCSVWGNAPNDQLLRILTVQKRYSRLISHVSFHDNSIQMFKKLQIGDASMRSGF